MSELMKPIEPKGRASIGRIRLGLCLLLTYAVSASAAPASDLPGMSDALAGTLFYSASERKAIAKARSGQTTTGQSSTTEQSTTEQSSTVVHVTGIVKRGGGKSTAWINGQAVPEGQSQSPTVKTTISASSVTVDGQRVRVGEALDINTRQREDIVNPGAVTSKAHP